jgi:hypothetical protein
MVGIRAGSRLLSAALAANLVVSLAGAAMATGRTVPRPVVVAGNRVGPVDVRGGNVFGTIASMNLAAGAWSILAKAEVVNTTSEATTVRLVHCRLVAGSDADQVQLNPVGAGADSGEQMIVLNVVHRFAGAGIVRLQCSADAATGDIEASLIRVTAVKAGRLTQETIGGAGSTTGSGIPRVISGRLAGPVNVANASGVVTVAELPVQAGPWSMTAKAYVQAPPGGGGPFECDLVAEGDFDRVLAGVDVPGAVADREPIAMTVVHEFAGSGVVDLNCQAFSTAVQLRSIVITATRAGRLTNRQIGGSAVSVGSGAPRIISAYLDGPTDIHGGSSAAPVGSMHLPAGAWSVVAKLYPENSAGPGLERVACRLVAGPGHDDIEVVESPHGTIDNVQPMGMVLAHRFTRGGGTVSVDCSSSGSTGDVQADYLKITAMKVSTLTTQPLA